MFISLTYLLDCGLRRSVTHRFQTQAPGGGENLFGESLSRKFDVDLHPQL